jgi:prevent-host-death family protein
MKQKQPSIIVGLKQLRNDLPELIENVARGQSFIVIKHSRPVFKITPVDETKVWESVIDFTQIQKGGVEIDELLSRL